MRRRAKLWSLVGGGVALASMMLTACGPSSNGGGGNTVNVTRGGTVINGLYEEPDTLLPYLTNETYAVIVDQALWAPLWYGDNTGALNAGIATQVPSTTNGGISSDLKTYTIKLKSGLKWSDGSAMTADDAVFSFQLYGNPAFANTFGFPTTDPTDPIGLASVNKVDSQTFTITLKNPTVTLNAIIADGAGSIIPKKVFGSMDPASIAKSTESFKPTVVSGPFMVQDRTQGDAIKLVKNPNYYQGPDKPYLDGITYKIIPDQNTILTALQSGSVTESWFLDVTKLDSYKAIPGYTTGTDKHPAGFEQLVFNLTNPILSDLNVRKALTMSFDSNVLIQQIYNGAAVKTCDDHGGTPYHEDSLTCYQQDVAGANSLLDQAGWSTKNSDGYRTKDGKVLELRYTTTNKASRKQTQLLAQAAWKAVGIKIDIVNKPANVFFGADNNGTLHSGDFDIGEFANTLGYDPDDHTTFSSNQTPDKGGSNYMHYSNSTVDQLESQQQQTSDVTARKQLFHQIHAQVLQDLPVMYLYTAANIFCYSNKLHNYAPSALGPSEGWNVWEWWLSK